MCKSGCQRQLTWLCGTVKRHPGLFQKALERTAQTVQGQASLLMAAPAGLQASAVLQTLAGRVTLMPCEADNYDSGGRRFDKIVRFATVDCVKAGCL